MGDVGRVVHTQPDGDDDVGAGDRVNREAPEVDEASNIDEGEDDTAEDLEARPDVEEERPGGEEDTEDGKEDVSVELLRDDFISLPGGVTLAHWEDFGGEVG